MNILLLGATGQVGFELHRVCSMFGTITAPDRTQLDLTHPQAVDYFLNVSKPKLILNAAAWTAVDAAEEKKAEAKRLNADLPAQLSKYAADNNVRLVHYSSDYVYPGSGDQPWQETSPTNPLSYYGETKLRGDIAITESGVDHLIFRTSWVYSARGKNFMKTMLELAENKSELDIITDQIGAPTPARLIAQVSALAIKSQLPTGLYNLVTKDETSWFGFAREIFRLVQQDIKLKPLLTNAYPTLAKRPLNSRLDVSKLEKALNIKLPSWQSQLGLTCDEYQERQS